ncbi:hypothetical protein CANCADRAFT_130685 [Tortispora caseinolytica NRRL Y-17796]|uniref:Galactose oxidase n=1 Tax=Tortispora caseinolytica NRRL Y-17796 TaxID=767744 RepID=A0A1E4TB46_9ASCO|nr:hypothetical protein CANCADRAFT_130685 [Tortispora caseinolytica NRRL Y-17796]
MIYIVLYVLLIMRSAHAVGRSWTLANAVVLELDHSFITYPISSLLEQTTAPGTLPNPCQDCNVVAGKDNTLYAIASSCAKTASVYKIDAVLDTQWTQLAISDLPFIKSGSSIFYDNLTSTLNIYGETCSDKLSNSLFYTVNLSTDGTASFRSTDTLNNPSDFFWASHASLGSQTLFIGGKTSEGYLTMTQAAFYNAGWVYRTISATGSMAVPDSRVNATTIALSDEKVLVVGGVVDGRLANPKVFGIQYSDLYGWHYTAVPDDVDSALAVSQAIGVLDSHTIIAVNRSADGYDKVFYNVDSWTVSSSYKPPQSDETAESTVQESDTQHKDSETSAPPLKQSSVVALSTILPICAITGVLAAAYFIRRRGKTNDEESGLFDSSKPSSTGIHYYDYPGIHNRSPSEKKDPFNDDVGSYNEQENAIHDVQLLVSVTKRGTLRVTNPDV